MSTKIHKGVFLIVSILLFLVSSQFLPTGPDLSSTLQNSGWSEPEILYILPDSTDGARSLIASFDRKKLTLTTNLIRRNQDFSALEFSYIAKIESDMVNPGLETISFFSDTGYLAEGFASLYQ